MCRTANGMDVNGLGQQKDGRGNICPVTIIMPTLAMKALNAASEEYDATGEADAIENAVNAVLDDGYRTGDIMQEGMTKVGCKKMGDLVAERI